jgi:peptidoglycan glycosyltransferase
LKRGDRSENADVECRWRQSQHRRQRKMSQRGLATIIAVPVGLVLAIWIGLGSQPEPEVTEPTALQPDPPAPISAGPPDSLFERLPVTDDVLELSVAPNELGLDRFREMVAVPNRAALNAAPGLRTVRIDYTFDPELTRSVFRVLRNARVALGHVILLDPRTGRVLSYASTDTERFPPTRAYPAASLIKVITAAAALDRDPGLARLPCRFRGSPYRLTPSRIDPPKAGNEVSLRGALASSNNQCFAQLAVHALGSSVLMDAILRFGWLSEPAPAHAAGSADPGEDRFGVGKLGCGLAGSSITPLHAAQLASTLSRGELVEPRWIEGVFDDTGRELPLPAVGPIRQVMTPELAAELREMLVDTTTKGTARRAFRKRNGRALLGPVRVAGKTGSLSGDNPKGRYEWFMGVAPADDPKIAIAVLLVQGDLYWRNASQVAAEVLRSVFCAKTGCTADLASRWVKNPTVSDSHLTRAPSAKQPRSG